LDCSIIIMSQTETPNDRAAEFRRRAANIRAMVKDFTTAEARDGLLRIAADWDRLADLAEQEAKRAPH
jgi:hypothetical protein